MSDLRIQMDHEAHTTAETPILAAKMLVCKLTSCGATFCQLRQGRGRRRGYCCLEHSRLGKIEHTRVGRRVWIGTGRQLICSDCGAEIEPPGPRGGRPARRCHECRQRWRRRYEDMKKSRRERRRRAEVKANQGDKHVYKITEPERSH